MEHYKDWFEAAIEAGILNIDRDIRDGIILTPEGVFINEQLENIIVDAFSSYGYKKWEFPNRISRGNLEIISLIEGEFSRRVDFDARVHWLVRGDSESRTMQASCPNEALRPSGESQVMPFWANNIQSYRDLSKIGKILLPQKVFRVPLEGHKTRAQFERTSIEGHALFQTHDEATSEMFRNIGVLRQIANAVSIPYVYVEAPVWDRNPFNDNVCNLRIVAEGGTGLLASAYNQGTNLSKPFGIRYKNSQNEECIPHVSTFGVGLFYQVLAANFFKEGFIIPPEISPVQVIIIPILKGDKDGGILKYVTNLKKELLNKNIRGEVDCEYGERLFTRREKYELSGVPIRLEVGENETNQNQITAFRRWDYDGGAHLRRHTVQREGLIDFISSSLVHYKEWSVELNEQRINQKIQYINSVSEIAELIKDGLIAEFYWCGKRECIQEMYGEKDIPSKKMQRGLVGIGNFLGWDPRREFDNTECIVCKSNPARISYWSRRTSL